MAILLRVLGRWLVPSLPYRPAFFADGARQLRAHLSGKLGVCVVGGIDSRACMETAMADGFAAVAVARPMLRDPMWLRRLEASEVEATTRACSKCGTALGASGPPLCHVCYGAVAIVSSAMAERPLRVGQWPIPGSR